MYRSLILSFVPATEKRHLRVEYVPACEVLLYWGISYSSEPVRNLLAFGKPKFDRLHECTFARQLFWRDHV